MKTTYIIGKKARFVLSEKSLERISDGKKISLRTPASFCLKLLLENQGKLVTHEELYHSGWQCFGMTASLSVLHNTIYYLRKNLNDVGDFDNKIIETINRRGFVFSLKVDVYSTTIEPEDTTVQDGQNYSPESIQENPGSMISVEALTENPVYPIPSLKDTSTVSEKALPASNIDKHEILNETRAPIINATEDKNDIIKDRYVSKYSRNYFSFFVSLSKNRSCMNFVFFGFFLPLFLLVFFSKVSTIYSFPSSYSHKGKLESCDVYQNNLSYDFNNLIQVDYLRNYCKSERTLYITYYPYTNKMSAINCRRKITLFSDDVCFSNYFIFNNNGLKNV